MSIFLTLAIYALRVSGDMPIESRKFPLISVYYFLSILYAFIALVWFLIADHISNSNTLSKFLIDFGSTLTKWKQSFIKKRVDPVKNFERKQKKKIDQANNNEMQLPLRKFCNQCEMCEKCLETKEKEETKEKNKKNIKTFVSYLNCIVFVFVAMAVFISNLMIWLSVFD